MAAYPRSSGHDGGLPSTSSSLLSNRTIVTSPKAENYPLPSQDSSGPHPPMSLFAEINEQLPLSLLPLPSSDLSPNQPLVRTQAYVRKLSEPVIGTASRSTVTKSNSYQEQLARQSLLPMPPEYAEGSHWTLLQLRALAGREEESGRRKWLRVEVIKKSLKIDGRWGREKPFVIEHRWEDWVDFRDQLRFILFSIGPRHLAIANYLCFCYRPLQGS